MSTLSALFAMLATLLAGVGLYGVLAYTVSQRIREFGLRMALGASVASVMALVMRQTLVLAGAGVATGLALAAGLTRLLGNFLYGVSPFDPATFIAVPLLLTAVVVVACWHPTHRATRVNPIEALRAE
jgi:ABC-type antimicrobial peptide transport system permease subunit